MFEKIKKALIGNATCKFCGFEMELTEVVAKGLGAKIKDDFTMAGGIANYCKESCPNCGKCSWK